MEQALHQHILSALNRLTFDRLRDMVVEQLEAIEHAGHCPIHALEPIFSHNGQAVPAGAVARLPGYDTNPWVIQSLADHILAQHVGAICGAFLLEFDDEADEEGTEQYKDALFLTTYHEHNRDRLIDLLCGVREHKYYREHNRAFMSDLAMTWAAAGIAAHMALIEDDEEEHTAH